MLNRIIKTLIVLVLYIACQIFIFNKISVWGYFSPMIYLLFILSLPFQTPQWLIILSGFFVGLLIDLFSARLGLHAFSTLVMAFLRPYIIRLISQKDNFEEHLNPLLKDMRFKWYFLYTFLLVFIHQLVYYFTEAFSLQNVWHLLFLIAINTMVTVACIFVIQILFYPSSKRY
ncbi:MAG: rod shape-determining protein MreD [Bacteroidales bacterium]|jgi:rod shape-determining protein MreD|nr:rod shape-determining protein MreD [Bacteroidales bacterium]